MIVCKVFLFHFMYELTKTTTINKSNFSPIVKKNNTVYFEKEKNLFQLPLTDSSSFFFPNYRTA